MGAEFSSCREYRYKLWRGTDAGPYCQFICLNPSTADETDNDRTITRCIKFAKSWGYDRIYVTNLFAFCDSTPERMMAQKNPEGDPENCRAILSVARDADVIIAAWGDGGNKAQHISRVKERAKYIEQMLKQEGIKLECLGKTNKHAPKHPLRLQYNTKRETYN